MSATYELRSATDEDVAFAVEMARQACVIEEWPLPDPDSEDVRSILPGSGDISVVAPDETGTRVGAAWTFQRKGFKSVGQGRGTLGVAMLKELGSAGPIVELL